MKHFTTTERKGVVALVFLLALLVGYMALRRGSSKVSEVLPVSSTVTVIDGDSVSGTSSTKETRKKHPESKRKKSHGRKSAGRKQNARQDGGPQHQRDYLNETVNE